MSISQEYENSYQLICERQRKIVFSLYDIMEVVSDNTVKARLQHVCSQQAKIYNVTKKYFDSLHPDITEKRSESRENLLGLVRYGEDVTNEVGKGRFWDISAHGACIQIDDYEDILEAEIFDLWFNFFGSHEPLKRKGRVQWVKRLQESSILCGMKFLSN